MSYPTLADFKAFLGITGSGEDTQLTWALASGRNAIERACHRTFVAVSGTRRFDRRSIFENGQVLALFRDFTAVTTLVNGDGVTVTEYYTVPEDAPYYALRLMPDAGITLREGTDGTLISMTADWGFSATCPDDVFKAMLLLARQNYETPKQAGGGAVGFRSSSGVGVEPGQMDWFVADVINRYRNYR